MDLWGDYDRADAPIKWVIIPLGDNLTSATPCRWQLYLLWIKKYLQMTMNNDACWLIGPRPLYCTISSFTFIVKSKARGWHIALGCFLWMAIVVFGCCRWLFHLCISLSSIAEKGVQVMRLLQSKRAESVRTKAVQMRTFRRRVRMGWTFCLHVKVACKVTNLRKLNPFVQTSHAEKKMPKQMNKIHKKKVAACSLLHSSKPSSLLLKEPRLLFGMSIHPWYLYLIIIFKFILQISPLDKQCVMQICKRWSGWVRDSYPLHWTYNLPPFFTKVRVLVAGRLIGENSWVTSSLTLFPLVPYQYGLDLVSTPFIGKCWGLIYVPGEIAALSYPSSHGSLALYPILYGKREVRVVLQTALFVSYTEFVHNILSQ